MSDNIKPEIAALIPEEFLDENGYPTDEFLDFVFIYKPDDSLPLLAFLKKIIIPTLNHYGKTDIKTEENSEDLLFLCSTGGWSGNEDILAELKANSHLKEVLPIINYTKGGHYKFKILKN